MTDETDDYDPVILNSPANLSGRKYLFPTRADWEAQKSYSAKVKAEREPRRTQIGLFYGIGPEPVPGDGRYWMGWIDHFYDLDWEKVPTDWKPGDPTAADIEREREEKAIREADIALALIVERSRGGRST
jgi:hypothetical protein